MNEPEPITFAEWVAAQGDAALASHPDAETLRHLYENNLMSDAEIGQQYGVSGETAGRWRRGAGIDARTPSEARRLQRLRQRYELLRKT